MTALKQNKHKESKIQQNGQNDQLIIFYKSYLRYMKKNIQNSKNKLNTQNTIFDLKKASGNVSLELFLQRIFSFFKCGKQAYICSLCFIDRFLQSQSSKNQNIKLNIKNVFKIISIALLVSTKNFDDFYYTNAYYARVCGLTLSQINLLEKQFLKIIDFNVFLQTQQYSFYQRLIQNCKNMSINLTNNQKQQTNYIEFQNKKINKDQNNFQITDEQAAKRQEGFKTQVEVVA